MSSHVNIVLRSFRFFHLNSLLFLVLAILPVGGCASLDNPSLSVTESSSLDLRNANEIDPAMRERILRAVGPDAQERALRDELQQHPDNVDAAIGLTNALVEQRRPHEALQVLDRLLVAAPGSLRVLNAKAVILDLEGRHDAAQVLYRQALELEPGNRMVQHNLDLSLAF
ncbi:MULTISPECIES: tetratricopeptide repeat protein [Mesorhizobium]|uniref:Tetratricopeptide repeat-containing protein n=1 Tax=Mesorhizobium qingshengii TaxID=1165689 RepID=A0A1G5ZYN2_9HYPH|nr:MULTISPECIES: tetratricopeptide repeat protein [Mesorhizobium]MCH4561267.1 tetratricopeptide repeat protein [Mesorhizobium jarvisii]QGU21186.1 tetratricopeptide repeat protein [Mesorhizobium huakuii 7653R]SDA99812.1 Tetratricopeptide repeat-containing protein [Mesorhizobium qingshengii]